MAGTLKDKLKYKAKKKRLGSYNRGNRTAQSQRYRDKGIYKNRAHQKVYRDLKKGKIVKPLYCENCEKNILLVGHHDNYDKKLEVKWLCYECHNKIHNDRR